MLGRWTALIPLACAAACGPVAHTAGDAADPGRDAGEDAGRDAASPTPADAGRRDAGPASMCPPGPCDLIAQDCPADEACRLGESGVFCAPAGTLARGDDCGTPDECGAGLVCHGGRCRGWCCGGSDTSCEFPELCLVQFVDGMGSPLGAGACILDVGGCDPVTQEGCAPGEGCYPNGSDGTTVCIGSTMNLGEGEDCAWEVNACAPGFACVTRACRAFCDVEDGDPPCPSGRRCVPFGSAFPPHWGACMPTG